MNKSCSRKHLIYLWLSGLMAAPAIVNLSRLVAQLDVSINGHEIPLIISGMAVVVGAGLSFLFAWLAFSSSEQER